MTSTAIYTEINSLIDSTLSSYTGTFKPTWLFIKQHQVTGKLYFHKAIANRANLHNYLGSGTYWVNHIKKHSKEYVETISAILFNDLYDCVQYAITISLSLDIVNSDEWANLVVETGINTGSNKGFVWKKSSIR